jgi:hypothetical protein
MNPPLIVTLRLEDEHQQFFNELRSAHFPSHINYLQAHLTLFHHLPSEEIAIFKKLQESAMHKHILLHVNEIRNLGNGIAYSIQSPVLQQFHDNLQRAFMPWLNSKDQQQLWPHITIQNRVTAFKAQTLFEQLNKDFTPFDITATGINTWLYLKGPWRLVNTFPFY